MTEIIYNNTPLSVYTYTSASKNLSVSEEADTRVYYSNSASTRKNLIRWMYKDQKGLCAYCTRKMKHPHTNTAANSPAAPTIDHIVPRCDGGNNAFYNTVLVCNSCNLKKDNRRDFTCEEVY